uniref:Uncharacterized protein n=1 Tax=Lactuca sativa TaxID=4236 RepID=A0A9R1X9J3_LACSA|nr:hypothetical protein LSAT_V11C500237180 [Lactuca sativa]
MRTDDHSEDEDFFMDLENIVDDVHVDMKDFHIHADEDVKWVQKTTKEASGSGVNFTEGKDNNRERMLRDIGKGKGCFEGVVHPKVFTLGQKFKTKKYLKDYINKYAVETKRDLHSGKNDKKRIRAKRREVVPDMSGGPWTNSRTGFKEKIVVLVSRPKETDDWVVNTLFNEHRCVQSRTIKACNYKFISTNIVKQIESNPTITVNALQTDLIQKFK